MAERRAHTALTSGRELALLVALVGALGACQSATGSTSPAPPSDVAVAPASALPSPFPSASSAHSSVAPTPTSPTDPSHAPALRPETWATVVTNGLRVRTEPFVGDSSVKLEPLLEKGADLFVIDGPVAGSGYDWYLVKPMPQVDLQVGPDPPAPGWVAAASHDGEPWLAATGDECFDTPLGWLTFDLMDRPMSLSALSCFGDRTLRFTAGLSIVVGGACSETTGPWTIDPAWLGPCPDPVYRLADPDAPLTDDAHAFEVTIAPTVDVRPLPHLQPNEWLIVDVVGQYAHPAADSCRATPTGGEGEGPPRPEVVVLDCRERFVVTSLAVHFDA